MSMQPFASYDHHQQIAQIMQDKQTGILTTVNPLRKLYFDQGELVFAKSEETSEQFAQILVEVGKLTAEQLAEIKEQIGSGGNLGRAIKDSGYTDPKSMKGALIQQIRRTVAGVLTQSEGQWEFTEGDFQGQVPKLKIQTLPLVIKCMLGISNPNFPPSLDPGTTQETGPTAEHLKASLAPNDPFVKFLATLEEHAGETVESIRELANMPISQYDILLYAFDLLDVIELSQESAVDQDAFVADLEIPEENEMEAGFEIPPYTETSEAEAEEQGFELDQPPLEVDGDPVDDSQDLLSNVLADGPAEDEVEEPTLDGQEYEEAYDSNLEETPQPAFDTEEQEPDYENYQAEFQQEEQQDQLELDDQAEPSFEPVLEDLEDAPQVTQDDWTEDGNETQEESAADAYELQEEPEEPWEAEQDEEAAAAPAFGEIDTDQEDELDMPAIELDDDQEPELEVDDVEPDFSDTEPGLEPPLDEDDWPEEEQHQQEFKTNPDLRIEEEQESGQELDEDDWNPDLDEASDLDNLEGDFDDLEKTITDSDLEDDFMSDGQQEEPDRDDEEMELHAELQDDLQEDPDFGELEDNPDADGLEDVDVEAPTVAMSSLDVLEEDPEDFDQALEAHEPADYSPEEATEMMGTMGQDSGVIMPEPEAYEAEPPAKPAKAKKGKMPTSLVALLFVLLLAAAGYHFQDQIMAMLPGGGSGSVESATETAPQQSPQNAATTPDQPDPATDGNDTTTQPETNASAAAASEDSNTAPDSSDLAATQAAPPQQPPQAQPNPRSSSATSGNTTANATPPSNTGSAESASNTSSRPAAQKPQTSPSPTTGSGPFSNLAADSAARLRGDGVKYTLAFMVACRAETLQDIFEKHSPVDMYILERNIKGNTCYILMWGEFDTYSQAFRSVDTVPEGLRIPGDKPWVVKVDQYLD